MTRRSNKSFRTSGRNNGTAAAYAKQQKNQAYWKSEGMVDAGFVQEVANGLVNTFINTFDQIAIRAREVRKMRDVRALWLKEHGLTEAEIDYRLHADYDPRMQQSDETVDHVIVVGMAKPEQQDDSVAQQPAAQPQVQTPTTTQPVQQSVQPAVTQPQQLVAEKTNICDAGKPEVAEPNTKASEQKKDITGELLKKLKGLDVNPTMLIELMKVLQKYHITPEQLASLFE